LSRIPVTPLHSGVPLAALGCAGRGERGSPKEKKKRKQRGRGARESFGFFTSHLHPGVSGKGGPLKRWGEGEGKCRGKSSALLF